MYYWSRASSVSNQTQPTRPTTYDYFQGDYSQPEAKATRANLRLDPSQQQEQEKWASGIEIRGRRQAVLIQPELTILRRLSELKGRG